MWCFGGFLLADRLDREYDLLGQKAGFLQDTCQWH